MLHLILGGFITGFCVYIAAAVVSALTRISAEQQQAAWREHWRAQGYNV
jgi:uncharacterized membrane protein YccF (DUF307 family)